MAEGRMLVRTISYDARINGFSLLARAIWPYACAHTETSGSIPRDPAQLRLMCIPGWIDVNDADMEKVILEWLTAKPAIVAEIDYHGDTRLSLLDFEKCNWDLKFFQKRRERAKQKQSPTVADSRRLFPEVKGSEVKRSEVKYVKRNNNAVGIPSAAAVSEYAKTIGFEVDGEKFCDYYSAQGWRLKNGAALRDWRAAVRNWKRISIPKENENDPRIAR